MDLDSTHVTPTYDVVCSSVDFLNDGVLENTFRDIYS